MMKWFFAVLGFSLILPFQAVANDFEFSAGFSYNRSNYSEGNYSWTRRVGTSIGFNFTELTGVEFALQDVYDRTHITNYEDTTFHDRVYSVNWIQHLIGRTVPIQPYFKLGVGQLNREASGTYAGGVSPPKTVDTITVVMAGGAKIYLTRKFAIRAEATSYLTGGAIKTWKDNVAITLGVSIVF